MVSAVATKSKSKKSTKPKTPKKPSAKKEVVKATRIAYVLDRSGSMSGLTGKVAELYSENIAAVKAAQPDALISLFYFDGEFDEIYYNVEARSVPTTLTGYSSRGSTALFAAVKKATGRIEAGTNLNKKKPDTSILVFVFTDGEETNDRNGAGSFASFIKERQATDLYTFAFLTPASDRLGFVQLSGVHDGNVQGWTDIATAKRDASVGIQSFMTARAAGQNSVKAFYQTDMSKVKKSDIKKLPDVANAKVWNVEKDCDIKSFVESHAGMTYVPGHGYYQLTKNEDIQEYKNLLVSEKTVNTRDVKLKDNARALLGLPATGTVKVKPGNHGNFDVYVSSNSTNRRLVRGTRFVYRV